VHRGYGRIYQFNTTISTYHWQDAKALEECKEDNVEGDERDSQP
jgi:hypothetical protein